ncbi:MAG: hypothetical protein HPY74_03115 [Firmicutes bacterium]|nr:hypothetical protein [Bacillota bacterium]
MLFSKSTHKQYQDFVLSFINAFYINVNKLIPVLRYAKHIVAFFISDLTGLYDIIRHAYTNSPCGAKPKDPLALFRSLILMTYCKFTSIDAWIKELRNNDLLAILSGFLPWGYKPSGNESYLPDTIPGVGTFYDFMDRLVIIDKLFHKSHYRRPRNSDLWNTLYNKRPSTERCNDRIKNDFAIKHAGVRSIQRWTVRVFLGAFCMYIDAWYKNCDLKITDLFPVLKDIPA